MLSFNKSFDQFVSIIDLWNTYGLVNQLKDNSNYHFSSPREKIIEVGSLSPRRDLLIEDTVRGIISAIENKKSIGGVINLDQVMTFQ